MENIDNIVMLQEHQQSRDLVAQMKIAFSQYLDGDGSAARQFKRHADAYITLLDVHIDKENNVLFPLAVKRLSASTLAAMKKGFDKIESEKVGEGKHEEFHRMLDSFERIYLQ